ncbi:hypothetical protein PAPHI01_0231 [Pancytospora philotis]|nr:hypothetical protein PAPHI01_0231 [Pancytospora philotis]
MAESQAQKHTAHKKKQAAPKQHGARKEITHTEFMGFMDRFYEALTLAQYRDFAAAPTGSERKADPECYRRYSTALKNRLCNCYIFDESVPVEDVRFDTELVPRMPIFFEFDARDPAMAFFKENAILDSFQRGDDKHEDQQLARQIAVNGLRREKIAAVIKDRIKVSGYFQAYNLLHQELETIYRRTQLRKKNSPIAAELDGIRAALDKLDAFYEAFGDPEQFTDDAFVHDDVLSSDSLELGDGGFKYLA